MGRAAFQFQVVAVYRELAAVGGPVSQFDNAPAEGLAGARAIANGEGRSNLIDGRETTHRLAV